MNTSSAQQLVLSGMQLKDDATFDNFFPGKNQLLLNFLQVNSLSDWCTYLWGKPDSGRTHLLQAICLQAKEQNKSAIYLPMETCIQLEPRLFDDLEKNDWVCIDDIQLIVGHAEWELALFHLYNRLQAKGCRLIMTANVAPRELMTTLPDLQSRLTSSMIFKLQPLNDKEKKLALQARAQMRGMIMSDEVADFLLRHLSRSLSDLFATLNKLDHASLAAQRRLTIPFVKIVLSE